MTNESDIERLLDIWLGDGPGEAPDRILDSVAARIGRQPQRPAWRLDRRNVPVNRILSAAVAVAAVIVIGVIGLALLGGNGSTVGAPGSRATGAPSSTSAPSTPGGTGGAVGACALITAAEVRDTLHVASAITVESVGGGADSPYCYFHSGGKNPLVLKYDKSNGTSTFAVWKAAPGVQTVPGLGDDAVWDPNQTTLFILKGGRFVSIAAEQGATLTLESAKAAGAIIAGRM